MRIAIPDLGFPIALVLVAVIATVAFFSFKSGDDRNFQIAKNLDTFNAIVKELDMFYVDTIDPNKTIREGIDNMLFSLDPYTEYYPTQFGLSETMAKRFTGTFGAMAKAFGFSRVPGSGHSRGNSCRPSMHRIRREKSQERFLPSQDTL